MQATRLETPVRGSALGVSTSVDGVHVNRDVTVRDFDEDTRVAVALELSADGDTPRPFDLRDLRLTMVDAAGTRQQRAPLASGLGSPPSRLSDDEHVGKLTLQPGEQVVAWVAFGEFPKRLHREIPERIELSLAGAAAGRVAEPTAGAASAEPAIEASGDGAPLVLSNPGLPPVWQGEGATRRFGVGLLVQAWDGGHAGNFMYELQGFFDPIWFTGAYGIGPREDFASDDDSCCNAAFRVQAGYALWQTSITTLSAYAGGEAALFLAADEDNPQRPAALGPSLGLSLSVAPLLPRHGPFPISRQRTPLGLMKLDAGLVWWFGDDIAPEGELGAVFGFTYGGGS